MTEPHHRLSNARKRAGYDEPTAAARAFGFNPVTYLAHESGRRGLTRAAAKRYASAFRVSAGWLLTGEGLSNPARMPIEIIIASQFSEPSPTPEDAEPPRRWTTTTQGLFGAWLADASANRRFPPGTVLWIVPASALGRSATINDYLLVRHFRTTRADGEVLEHLCMRGSQTSHGDIALWTPSDVSSLQIDIILRRRPLASGLSDFAAPLPLGDISDELNYEAKPDDRAEIIGIVVAANIEIQDVEQFKKSATLG